MKILVIDIGGTSVKLRANQYEETRKFPSGKDLSPRGLVERVREMTRDWDFEAVSLGYPGLTGHDGPRADPINLAPGWVGFDFQAAFQRPVRILNDAAMQALGSYQGGRMLFLGLGTALGTTLISDMAIVPLEIGRLPFRDATFVECLGRPGRERLGAVDWQHAVEEAVAVLQAAFIADYVVLGGGHAEDVDPLPHGARRGGNDNAIQGGFRIWETPVQPIQHVSSPEVWKLIP